ncbi:MULTISPECIES: MgtC/SapB family protein [Roseivirga]|jgi:putative Mg2+ transporter-C (MgtC) family protein|uniref:MgtC/SapB family protein n=1 Tax=Roseivirga TaxID=290180 RepID=UPI000A0535CA|nr:MULTISPECIES: MgtC/SapB family protein [Roseivirga]PWL31630.1 MAG: MgtC/SapB family protein [Roseivirga sp. XM-24bin3]MBO6495705.1 MgtC/SapB family protein [Roseivirga sp.]MBO6659777.1 MgtC/SapB family protein [Roseivirga sp.]MBO6907486.1 MgtC/SapB family protein [Roseivirga sp.]WPZ09859.1 MgtC/SapB family protein [Roseivirga spongicola]
MIDIAELEILMNTAAATILCGFVGLEREKKEKPAGLRTNMIVGSFSCLIVSLAIPLIDLIQNSELKDAVDSDPIRMLQALVVGISFIGAGTIIKKKEEGVEGLTTAATLLYCLGIGISVALEKFVIAVGITILILLINNVFGGVKKRIVNNPEEKLTTKKSS